MPRRRRDDPHVRIALWAAMVAAIAWTLVYRQATRETGIPEFVYVNF